MFRSLLTKPKVIRVLMVLQILPLLAMPPSSYSLTSQEWWLPAFLCIMVCISLVRLLSLKGQNSWAWRLIAFSQGFNIISRLMMLFPHATFNDQGIQRFNSLYVGISVGAMLVSAFEIWYQELPEVRARLSV
jgi:hypothetical protein